MAIDHVAGGLETSGVTYHLLTSHSLRDPPCSSQNLKNSLGGRTPWGKAPRQRGQEPPGGARPSYSGRSAPGVTGQTPPVFSVDLAYDLGNVT